MFTRPLLYILNHKNIFGIGFDEDSTIDFIPFISVSFLVFSNFSRFANGLALFNNYLFGDNNYKILENMLILLVSTLIVECYIVCFAYEFNLSIFAGCFLLRQYLYGSIDYTLDQMDIAYNQSYRVIGLLPLMIMILGIVFKSYVMLSLKLYYSILIFSVFLGNYLVGLEYETYRIKNKEIKIDYTKKKENLKRVSIDKFIWIFIMLLMVSYVDGAGDAIATEKLWNSKDINYFIINQLVRIVTSILTFPPIQKLFITSNNKSNYISSLIIFRFILLVSMKYVEFKSFIFLIQCSIDIYVGTVFMNDYLDKNKQIFWRSSTNSKYYVSASFAYFINENVPPFIKMVLVLILTKIGKQIEIGIYFTLPIMSLAILCINTIPIIQNKLKNY
tara:strand:- start:31 stop:1197 length:1167 start_codon:yes stop_codon:yes gene_type:complete